MVLTDLQKAILQTLEYCISEHGKSQHGYFSPGGWAGEELLKVLPEKAAEELLLKFRNLGTPPKLDQAVH